MKRSLLELATYSDESVVKHFPLGMKHTLPLLTALLLASTAVGRATASEFDVDIRPLLERHCFDCHDSYSKEGDLDLSRFTNEEAVMKDRAIWRTVYEKIESHQMPPPDQDSQPLAAQRQELMQWIMDIASRPDVALGVRDPGKPVLRRLTRLEYNNTVRDLFGLSTDVFMFPERLPLAGKSYFQPASGKLLEPVDVKTREYGGKYPALLPLSGLPGDSRAEHGFSNRGDVMNFTPMLLEKYLTLAGEIAQSTELVSRSETFATLLGIEFKVRPVNDSVSNKTESKAVSPAVGVFAPKVPKLPKATGSADNVEARFREEITEAFQEGHGGVFDVGRSVANTTVPGKGAILRIPFGDAGTKTLTINPDQDLWLAPFATADESSGELLFTNKTKNSKVFELTFKVENGDQGESITRLGICVIGRRDQKGTVTLTAKSRSGIEQSVGAEIAEGAIGTTLYSFAAAPNDTITSLVVDGSKFSGDYVLLDDLGFITNGKAIPNAAPPEPVALAEKEPKAKPTSEPVKALPKAAAKPAVERLTAFIERAFRRPATEDERARIQAVFQTARSVGKSEEDAMRAAVQVVLASPSFLYLGDTNDSSGDDPSGDAASRGDTSRSTVQALDDFALASRLSYFLWASAPDEELLAAASAGKLRDAEQLEAQTRRMLKDNKSRELSESFAVQWLRLDQLYTSKPDSELFPAFYAGPQGKNTLHAGQLIEALLLFETVHVEDRSILDFVQADYTWLNPRLAKLYDIDLHQSIDSGPNAEVATTQEVPKKDNADAMWHRVSLKGTPRGGYMTMAAPMTITSLPFRTSPVKRGAWLLETIFNRPPTEPKVAFAIENDTKEAAQQMSIRQKFEAHRNQAACYSCHIRLDPPGFALERFNPVGQWRETDGAQPVDASSEWNGQPFDGPAEFKALIAENPHEFTRGFIEHLLSYAINRRLEVYDMPTVEQIEQAAKADGWKFSRVVTEIAKSFPFTHTRRNR